MITTIMSLAIAALALVAAWFKSGYDRQKRKADEADKVIKTVEDINNAEISGDVDAAREWLRKHGKS